MKNSCSSSISSHAQGFQYFSRVQVLNIYRRYFLLKYENAGNDFIDDFTVGNTNTNTNADIIDLRDY